MSCGSMPASFAGRQDRLQRQLELAVRRLAVLVVGRLADAGDHDLAAQCSFGHVVPPGGQSDRGVANRQGGQRGGRGTRLSFALKSASPRDLRLNPGNP